MKDVFYKDKNKQWRWRYVDPSNGNILADSAEGYHNRKECEASYAKVTGSDILQLAHNSLQLMLNDLNEFREGRKK